MKLFEEILKESGLLLENVNTNDIKFAIENSIVVSLMYDDQKRYNSVNKKGKSIQSKGKGKSWRYICPVAYGELKNGAMAVRALQFKGSSLRGVPEPSDSRHNPNNAWKLFRTDRIISWHNQTNDPSDEAHTFNPDDIAKGLPEAVKSLNQGRLNKTGDNQMVSIIYHSPAIKPEQLLDSEPKTDKNNNILGMLKKEVPSVPTTSDNVEIEPQVSPNTPKPQNNIQNITKNIDNTKDTDYTVNSDIKTLEAPPTEPVSKDTIDPDYQEKDVDNNQVQLPNENPIEKEKINSLNTDEEEKEELQESKFINTFKSLLDRWNNI